MLRSNSRIRTNTIFCSMSGIWSMASDRPDRPARSHPLGQLGSAVLRLQPETPQRGRVGRILHRPAEHSLRLEFDDMRGGRPLAQRLVLVAADEPHAQRRLASAVEPFHRLQFRAHSRHQLDVGYELPDPGRRSVDPGPRFYRGLVRVARSGPFHDRPPPSGQASARIQTPNIETWLLRVSRGLTGGHGPTKLIPAASRSPRELEYDAFDRAIGKPAGPRLAGAGT